MTTIIINKRTKAGKLLFEMAKLLSEKEEGVVIKENNKEEKSPYNPEFVKKVKEAEKNIEQGKTITLDPNNVWESILSK